jgi:NAD-dependent deacetylase
MIQIKNTDRVFVLTGAGISAESGIPTFRDSNGLWCGHNIEDVATPQGWRRDPALVWQFYSMRRRDAAPCQPNPAHKALADLETMIGDRLTLCTQNVDDLHEKAGSTNVLHMHGWLFKSRCERCEKPKDDLQAYTSLAEVPNCPCDHSGGSRLRPHIVWFGEMPFFLDEIEHELHRSTIFICIGSSGVVEPAASFARMARNYNRAKTYYVGPEAPANDHLFDQSFLGKAGEVLPSLFQNA